jgi:4-alpha-glucanotransferase
VSTELVPSGARPSTLPKDRTPLRARTGGVLLHLSSLPGPHAIGDLGQCARDFVDALACAEQRIWQMLPVCALGDAASPYSSTSSFAGEPRFVSLAELCDDGLLELSELPPDEPVDHTDYTRAFVLRRACFDAAQRRFRTDGARFRDDHAAFVESSSYWLDDFACFEALRRAGRALHVSARGFALARDQVSREPALAELVERVRFEQYLFDRQWRRLRAYATARGVALMGDLPIFVDHHSADVAAHPEVFKLREDGTPRVVSGVPPDYFSETGQRWGTPVFDADALRVQAYGYFVERFRTTLARFELARIDHFIGFAHAWEIPAAEVTAVNGVWVQGPGEPLFRAASAALGALPFVAEDLGSVSSEVLSLRDRLGFPGMRVLQFGFDSDTCDPFLPHNYACNTVAYTGTHDNDTWLGFVRAAEGEHGAPSERTRQRAARYLGVARNADAGSWVEAAAHALYASAANTVILPLQDVLAQGSEARMNVPGTSAHNFLYRAPAKGVAERLLGLTSLLRQHGRGAVRDWPPPGPRH